MDNRRKWTYTLDDIAQASMNSINTVRDHKQRGDIDPGDLVSVAQYIKGFRTLHAIRKSGGYEVDEWGDPL